MPDEIFNTDDLNLDVEAIAHVTEDLNQLSEAELVEVDKSVEMFMKPEIQKPVEVKKAGMVTKFDLSKLAKLPGVIVGEIGIKVSRFPVERLKFNVGKRYRVCPIMDEVIVVKTHYDEGGLGSFVCFDGACCEKFGLPTIRYLMPVVVYDTNDAGKFASTEIENKVIALSKDAYESMMVIKEEFGTVTNCDIIITCSDEKFQKIQCTPLGKCAYANSPKLVKEVSEFWEKNFEFLIHSIAKPMDSKKFKELGQVSADAVTEGSEEDFKALL